jgi:hypothetical protein
LSQEKKNGNKLERAGEKKISTDLKLNLMLRLHQQKERVPNLPAYASGGEKAPAGISRS